jgi:sugar-specific transcriptional regulator TrmB
LAEETLRKVLKDFGLTDSEVDLYLFVSKQGILSGTDAAHLLRKDKAQIFRTLKNLEMKGFMETTLEVPMRFIPVPFEKVLESTIKAKKEEAARIEDTKAQLLDYWKELNKKTLNFSLEKFVVIEGRHKVYSKISQMVMEAKGQLSAVSTVSGLLRAEQFGIFDISMNESRRTVQFRLLTDLSSQNEHAVKNLLKKVTKKGFNFKGRNPELGLTAFPRMVIRDKEEVIFFLTSRAPLLSEEDNSCLWTNCRDLVEAFTHVFEDLWQKASDVQDKSIETRAGKIVSKPLVSIDPDWAISEYWRVMRIAKTEILALTSSDGLDEFSRNISLLEELAENKVSIRILAPISNENLHVAQQLSKCCQVKHTVINYLKTVLVDGHHLFQFRNPSLNVEGQPAVTPSNSAFYTSDIQYVERAREMFSELWDGSSEPSLITLGAILDSASRASLSLSGAGGDLAQDKIDSWKPARKVSVYDIAEGETISEKDILNKIINAKKYEVKDPSKDLTRVYGFQGQAVVHPPSTFGLPDFMIHAFHNDKQSSYGVEDTMIIYLWLETPAGFTYVPVAIIGDVPKGAAGFRALYAGTPAGDNVRIVKKDEFQVQLHGNTFFAGWTVPIPLLPTQYVLPPSAIVLEAFGKLKTGVHSIMMPSRYEFQIEANGFNAFVTFYHPASRYSGPGTDGYINRDFICTTTPP